MATPLFASQPACLQRSLGIEVGAGEATPGAGLEGGRRQMRQKVMQSYCLRNNFGQFLIDVFGAPLLKKTHMKRNLEMLGQNGVLYYKLNFVFD